MDNEYKYYVEKITEICNKNGFITKRNIKVDNIKIDVLVEFSSFNVGFCICKRPLDIEKKYKTLKEKRISCCWLLLKNNQLCVVNSELPCFKIYGMDIILNSSLGNGYETSIHLENFIPLISLGKVKLKKEIDVKYIDVCFLEINCWKCKEKNHIYYVKRLIADDGFIYPYNLIDLNPIITSVVRNYLIKHPEKNIKIGDIKERFSRTINESYLSFGCYKCDNLFGNYFIKRLLMEEQYYEDSDNTIRIDMENANIKYPISYWCKI